MGFTLQAESHRNELVWARRWDLRDDDVLELWDQPVSIKLVYQSKNGRRIGVGHTPDYLLLRRSGAELIECKPEEILLRLAEEQPNRYVKIDGTWTSPPAEEALRPYGIRYRIASTAEINPVEARNMLFLEDYLRPEGLVVPEQSTTYVTATVAAQEGIVLSHLLEACRTFNIEADDVYALIVTGHIYVDLETVALAEPYAVPVFSNRRATLTAGAKLAVAKCSGPVTIDLEVGTKVRWDNNIYQIVNASSERVWIKPREGEAVPLETAELYNLIKSGLLTAVAEPPSNGFNPTAAKILSSTSIKQLQKAHDRYQQILPFLTGDPDEAAGSVAERTLRRLLRQFRDAQEEYNCGFVGLIADYSSVGRPPLELPEEVKELQDRYCKEVYETPEQKGKLAVYSLFKQECEAKGYLDVPCYKSFVALLNERPRHTQVSKRKGRVASYKFQFYYWLDKHTPRHGDRPFEICHVDHTLLDDEIISSINGENLGRPWLTLLLDAYSRRILAIYLTFDEPSYRSCMMVLRECVRRWGRLPQTLVVDGGREFHSTFFNVLTAIYQVTKKTRPARKPRNGSVGERIFGTTNSQFAHVLTGNTQMMRDDIREVCAEVNPKKLALWTLSSVYDKLCEWAYEVYDQRPHWTLKQSPKEMFENGIDVSGKRRLRGVAYDEDFMIYTLPSTRKGSAKVNVPRGIKINNFYYWCEDFRDPALAFKQVPVRYDPYDISIAYVFVHNSWVKCYSDETQFFHWRTEKEVRLAAAAMRRLNTRFHQNTFSVSANAMARFLRSIANDEEILKDKKLKALRGQHLKDLEARTIISTINQEPLPTQLVLPSSTLPLEETPDLDFVEPDGLLDESVCEDFEIEEAIH
jgi:transposase InsO family protein